MRLFIKATTVLIFSTLTLVTTSSFASEDLFRQARQLQREGQLDEAIELGKKYGISPSTIKRWLDTPQFTHLDLGKFAKLDESIFDLFLKSTLFGVQFPDANSIKYSFLLGEQLTPTEAPIKVEGNKMTIKMSELNSVYRDVVYMPTSTFINFFGNMQINLLEAKGQIDITDAAAVKAEFDKIDDAVETINVSLVMTSTK